MRGEFWYINVLCSESESFDYRHRAIYVIEYSEYLWIHTVSAEVCSDSFVMECDRLGLLMTFLKNNKQGKGGISVDGDGDVLLINRSNIKGNWRCPRCCPEDCM